MGDSPGKDDTGMPWELQWAAIELEWQMLEWKSRPDTRPGRTLPPKQ